MFQIMGIIGVIFFILEIFTPAMFFLNLAFAAFLTALVALFVTKLSLIILTFVVLSAVMLLILRPILVNLKQDKSQLTGIQDKYIGKTVKVITPITSTEGAITIYGERWDARTLNDETIEEGADVRIIKNESLVMFVERV